MDERRREQVRRAAIELSTWGAVAVVGAGASRALGFPMTDQLHALIWHALDADTAARDALASELGSTPALAKELIGDDPARVHAALQAITASERARHEYQHGFARLNEERNRHPSPGHHALAELLHRGAITSVVSLNWDTLLETAYRRRYGSRLVPGGPFLYKPHGDAAHPDIPWMLPHEAGHIPAALEAHMAELVAERPRSLLVVGYSERDEEVVRKLTRPLAGRWRVIRITPSARDELAIALGAEEALPALLGAAYPNEELPGWEYVHFDRQHDLGPVLLGRRLGPRDVEACPRLPELADVGRQLAVGHSALIVAEPGHGKSVTAYQAAHDLARDGYEVLQPASQGRVTQEMVGALGQLRRPTVVVVDDAHLTDERILRQLYDSASADRAVIAASTATQTGSDNGRQGEQVRLSGPRAVEVIARHFGERRDELLRHVRRLDDRIGDHSFEEPFERRLAEAAKGTTPWQFTFVLTAGWRRAENTMATLRDDERADLLLAAVAIGQYLERLA